jgi:hypothetical protein
MVYESDSAVKRSCIRMHGRCTFCVLLKMEGTWLSGGCKQQIPHAPQSGGSE